MNTESMQDLPVELKRYILDFIDPYLTRSDWKTCRQTESDGIKQLAKLFTHDQVLDNGSWKIDPNHDFYNRLLYGRVVHKKERDLLFPRKYLRLTVWNIF
jgi:hypothetical protein